MNLQVIWTNLNFSPYLTIIYHQWTKTKLLSLLDNYISSMNKKQTSLLIWQLISSMNENQTSLLTWQLYIINEQKPNFSPYLTTNIINEQTMQNIKKIQEIILLFWNYNSFVFSKKTKPSSTIFEFFWFWNKSFVILSQNSSE